MEDTRAITAQSEALGKEKNWNNEGKTWSQVRGQKNYGHGLGTLHYRMGHWAAILDGKYDHWTDYGYHTEEGKAKIRAKWNRGRVVLLKYIRLGIWDFEIGRENGWT